MQFLGGLVIGKYLRVVPLEMLELLSSLCFKQSVERFLFD